MLFGCEKRAMETDQRQSQRAPAAAVEPVAPPSATGRHVITDWPSEAIHLAGWRCCRCGGVETRFSASSLIKLSGREAASRTRPAAMTLADSITNVKRDLRSIRPCRCFCCSRNRWFEPDSIWPPLYRNIKWHFSRQGVIFHTRTNTICS